MHLEATAIGAAYLAGLQAGLLPMPEIFAKTWKRDKRFGPEMGANTRVKKITGWKKTARKLLPLTGRKKPSSSLLTVWIQGWAKSHCFGSFSHAARSSFSSSGEIGAVAETFLRVAGGG
jgi:hypothetical protein